ncbi:MAG: DNA repair protein RecN [Deltaproteobacteria bacterium]|nr:DNA repair protein RecN [Deltaproteobacteria bacterium]
MLSRLEIRNFGVIEESQLDFQPGFTVLSGETGSGKSIILQALNFVLGEKLEVEALRAGSQDLEVRASFEVPFSPELELLLKHLNLDLDETWIFSRCLNRAGKTKAYFNNQVVTLKTLKELGSFLLLQANQHAALKLFDSQYTLGLLDTYGRHEELLSAYTQAYQAYLTSYQELKALEKQHQEAQEKQDYWTYQLKELTQAKLQAGELEKLEIKKQRLKNKVQLLEALSALLQLAKEGEWNLSEQLSQSLHWANKASRLDESFAASLESLESLNASLETLSQDWERQVEELSEEGEDFEASETRLFQLKQLEKKYAKSVEELIVYEEVLKERLAVYEDFEFLLKEAQQKLQQASSSLVKEANRLSQARKNSVKTLKDQVLGLLDRLALPKTRLELRLHSFEDLADFSPQGAEVLQIWLSFNPGEDLRPFEEVISGGELSRFLLALFLSAYPASPAKTFIFDEIDSGVGGQAAELMGRRLQELSQKSQVLAVTHLPQVAALAQWHYRVEKTVQGERTFTRVKNLEKEERVQELARMLAGLQLTPQALEHAREMLN